MNRLEDESEGTPMTVDTSRISTTHSKTFEASSNLPKLNFPAKLHLILSSPEFNDAICWLPHGRAWRVQKQDQLEQEVLPKFFQHKKAASFYRQVTGWGFHRITSGTDFNAYHHKLFLRDAPDLCRKMKRPTRSEVAERKQSLSKAPPDFYNMAPVAEETSSYPTYTSQNMTLDENMDMLVRRLSTYSLPEKSMFLQLELNKLGKKKAEILKQLKGIGFSSSEPSASSMGSLHSTMQSNNLEQTFRNNQGSINPYHAILNNPLAGATPQQLNSMRLSFMQRMQPNFGQLPLSNGVSQLALAHFLLETPTEEANGVTPEERLGGQQGS